VCLIGYLKRNTLSKTDSKILMICLKWFQILEKKNPGIVLDSLARVQEIWDLSLLSGAEFISTLLSKALGSFA